MFGLQDLLTRAPQAGWAAPSIPLLAPTQSYCSPGYWVTCAAGARSQNLALRDLPLTQDLRDYAIALGIQTALQEEDTYQHSRINAGKNYSPLVLLGSSADADSATTTINSCLRSIFQDQQLSQFVSDLSDVVGDLHDNVWSHGKSTGISAAQKWRCPLTDDEYYIEFALADCGVGFLRELERSNVAQTHGINDHQSAIAWCIQQGNSSKKREVVDDWEQRLPWDTIGNPIGADARPIENDNHHQGLGLYKLTSLVQTYRGELWLASGSSMLKIDSRGTCRYVNIRHSWQGVALACRFRTDEARRGHSAQDDTELNAILQQLFS